MNRYQLICEAYDLVHESYYTPVVLTTGIGLAGLGFRFKRQADDYKKIKTKFPTPQKMLDFLNSKGIQDTQLNLIVNNNDSVSYGDCFM